MAKAGTIRGLQVFISDIRACQNREQEAKRVDKELAKIRSKFSDEKKALTAYDRKKYVWKLLYIYMLGYDVEFGHKQACDLIPATKYSEKQVGYMACSILMNEKDEFLRLSINAIHNDLTSRNEAFQCLALAFVGNIAGQEMAEALTPDVLKLLSSGTVRPVVVKKAALCLLRLLRKTPLDQQLLGSDTFGSCLAQLLDQHDLGLQLCVVTLLLGICSRVGPAGYESCAPRLVRLLQRLVYCQAVSADYTYYGIASPWLQVKVLRCLQYFPPPDKASEAKALHDILAAMFAGVGDIAGTGKGSNANKSNAQHAILFEAIGLVLVLDTSRELLASSVAALARFLTVKEANIKYLALENLARLAAVPEVMDEVSRHQEVISAALKDPDLSIRKRALDLLFTMCDASNAKSIVEELVRYTTIAEFSMREELVIKIAILAEKFAPSLQWYMDVCLSLLERAGDFVEADVWHRVVQLVTNNEGMQAYAAVQLVDVLKRGAAHESLMATAAYVLGEYGRLIQAETPAVVQFKLLHDRFPSLPAPVKGLLLSAYLKLLLASPGDAALSAEVTGVFERVSKYMDAELQQRAVEYMALAKLPAQQAAQQFVLPMPKWEARESGLLRRLQAQEGGDADRESAPAAPQRPTQADEQLAVQLGAGRGVSAALAATAQAPGAPTDAPPAPQQQTQQPATPAAPAVAPRAAPVEVDLLGGDYDLHPAPTSNGHSTPAAAATAPAQGAAPVDPFEHLFGPITSAAPPPPPPAAGARQQPPPAAPPAPAASDPFSAMAAAAPPPPPPDPFAAMASTAPPAVLSSFPSDAHQLPASSPYSVQSPSFGMRALPLEGSGSLAAAPSSGSMAPVWGALRSTSGSFHGSFHGSGGGSALASAASGSSFAQQPPQMAAPPSRLAHASSAAPSTGATPTAAYTATAAPTGFSGAEAYGNGGAPAWAAAAPAPAAALVPAAAADIQQWYEALLSKEKGVLYEDEHLQLGLASTYSGAGGELQLYMGNKSGSVDLTQLALYIPPTHGLAVSLGLVPHVLQPKQQVQVAASLRCLAPEEEPLLLQMGYALGGSGGPSLAVELRLPVASHKFMTPQPHIAKEAFFATWKAYAGPPLKQQEMVERRSPLGAEQAAELLRGLGFGCERGHLDPSPHNEAGAALFSCGPPGNEASLLVQVRVEANPANRQQFRVTVAAPHPALATELRERLAHLLRTWPA